MPHAPHGIMPGGGSVLDPVLQKYMEDQRRMQVFQMLSRAGQALMGSNRRGQSPIRALAAGLAQGRPAGTSPIKMLQMQEVLDRTRARQDKRQRARGQHASQEALTAGNRYDPRNQILWNTPPALGREPPPMTPEQRRSLAAQAYPEAAAAAGGAEYFPQPATYGAPVSVIGPNGKPMLIRVPQGRGAPIPLGGGYRPMPKSGGITLSQQSSNAEIDQARATLDRKGLDKAEIYRRTQKATNTGRTNTEYDEGLDRIVRMATQRKTGPDPDYRRYYGLYLGGVELSEPAGMAPLPPGVSAEEPGIIDRVGDYLFGGGEADAQPAPPPPGAMVNPSSSSSAGRMDIENMTAEEISGIINTEKAQSLTQDELDRMFARLGMLGFK